MMIADVLNQLKGRCRWFDVIETFGTTVPVVFRNNRLHSVQEKENSGFGIRVNIGNRTGFSYTNATGGMPAAADRAVSMARYGDEELFDLPGQVPECAGRYYDEAIDSFSVDAEIGLAESAIGRILSALPGASVDVSVSRSTGGMRLVNSNGFDGSYTSSLYSAGISLTWLIDGGSKVDIWEGVSARSPVDYSALAEKIAGRAGMARLERKCPAGKMPVIFTPKASSRILGIVASGLNAKSVWKGISPFAGKKGERLFNEKFSLYDDPGLDGSPYNYPFDDEGVVAARKALIERGRIVNFVTDLKHAHKLGIPAMGNGSRGYSSLPAPSFSNTSIDPGEDEIGCIMKSIDRGILVDQFIGLGQSNTLTGDFSANLDLAFLIEKGEITGRVKDCMLADNLLRLLEGDMAMSRDREMIGSSFMPYILFPSVNYTC